MAKEQVPLTKLILGLLAGTGKPAIDFYSMLYDMRHYHGAYLRGGHASVQELKRLRREQDAKRALRQLQYAKYVKARRIGKRLEISLTQKGLAVTLALQLKQAAKSKLGYTVVIFDVPQSENAARRQLRLLLRQGGFTKLQQSVWISQKDVYRLLADFIKKVKLEQWVNIFYGSNLLHLPPSLPR